MAISKPIIVGIGLFALLPLGWYLGVPLIHANRQPMFIAPKSLELGDQESGKIATAKFSIENRGGSPLTLDSFGTSCSYSQLQMKTITEKGASWSKVESVTIPPHSSAEFGFGISVNAEVGAEQVVSISGKSNDPNHPNWQLPVRIARVTGWVCCQPKIIVFDSTQVPFQPIQQLLVYANGDDARQITGAKPFPPERFITRVQPAPADTPPHPTAGKAIGMIEVELKSPTPGPVWGKLAIEVDGKLPDERLYILITGEVPSAETPTK